MSTSLAEQLRRLAAPQTSILQDSKKRASILFDAKEAATKDRQTIYDLAITGLHELTNLNPVFLQFEKTLFNKATINMERSVESAEVNQQLDKNIKKFFYWASPYFMLHPTHLCLEWLIRRYHIHEFNRDEFMALVLPYHETKIFVKCVQLLVLKNPNDNWYWLKPIQKPGVPLPKSAIINRAGSENFFLGLICKSTIEAIKELDTKAHMLQTAINFYCLTVIGALENTKQITESHITTILPSILKGLGSYVVDFTCAAFMITTQLVVKCKALSDKLLNSLISRITVVPFENMRFEVILLLTCIFQRQSENANGFPVEDLVKFVRHRWVSETISELNGQGCNIQSLAVQLVSSCIKVIQEGNSEQIGVCKAFLEKFLIDVRFVEEDVKEIISETLKSYKPPKSNKPIRDGEVIELDSDEDEPMDETFHGWFCDFVQKFERQYPNEFDQIVKDLLKDKSTTESVKQALKIVVSYRLDTASLSNNDSAVFENLYHYNARNRVEGVKFLIKNFDELSLRSEKSSAMLKETISDRLKDDNQKVLVEVLKIPTPKLIETVGEEDLVNSLASIVQTSQLQGGNYSAVLKSAVSHFSKCSAYPLKVTLATLPLSKPIVGEPTNFDLKFLSKLKAVSLEELLNYNDETWTPLKVSYYITLLESRISNKISSALSAQAVEKVESLLSKFKVTHVPKDEKGVFDLWRNEQVPQFLVLSFYTKLVKTSKKLPAAIYNLFATRAFTKTGNEKQEYALSLKTMLEFVFPNPQDKLSFLADFFAYEEVDGLTVTPELSVISVRLFSLVLQGKNSSYEITDLLLLKILISLCSEFSVIRECALEAVGLLQNSNKIFKEISGKSEEIQMDGEQFPLILSALAKKKSAEKVIEKLLTLSKTVDIFLKSKILNILKYINSSQILLQVIPIANESLKSEKSEGNFNYIEGPHVQILENAISRFDEKTIGSVLLDDPKAWEFLKVVILKNKTFLGYKGNLVPISAMVIDLLDEEVFREIPEKFKGDLLCLIVSSISSSGNNNLFAKGNKFLKKCGIDGKHVQSILEKMFNSTGEKRETKKPKEKRRSVAEISSEVVNSLPWKEGVTLLELMENKKKIENSSRLIPILFEILKVCLQIEEQSVVEYSKQLLLSALLHLCQKYQDDQKSKKKVPALPESTFRIDLIVQCVRGSQNPQTHNQALLLLSHCAIVYPQQVLHNIMDIFTFMGSSVVRHDDVFSFQIISNIIESVIPTIVKKDNKESVDLVIPVFKVFADILLDVPEHRRIPLYTKLLSTLGTGKYLWMFLCVVLESHVIHDDEDKKKTKGATTFNQRLEICLQLVKTFSSQEILETCIQLMSYLQSLPVDVNAGKANKMEVDLTDTKLFDVDARSSRQLRHYRYIIIQFVSNLTSSKEFINTIALLNDEETKLMKPFYQSLIIKTLSYIPNVSSMTEKNAESKYWKVCLSLCYDVLDNSISLLSPDMFAVVVNGLIKHNLLIIRRKVIDLLNNKLQHSPEYFTGCDPDNLLNLLDPLKDIIAGIVEKNAGSGDVIVYVQQSALVAIKLLSKLLAADNIAEFQEISNTLTSILKVRKTISKALSATIILTIVEISANLKAHAISNLPKFMPLILEVLQDQVEILAKYPPDSISIAIVTSVQKIYDVIPLFMSPYVEGTLKNLSILWHRIKAHGEDAKTKVLVNKLSAIWTKISNDVPSRIVVPCVEKVYEQLMEDKYYEPISILMKLLIEGFNVSKKFEFKPVHQELTDLFLKALEFRSTLSSHPNQNIVNEVEEDIVNAFVAWVLKLSEGSFRPLYHKIYDWAIRNDQSKTENAITYFILSNKISQSLKSLFVLFASDFIEDAAKLLNKCNQSKDDSDSSTNVLLLKNIVNTLYNVFLYDTSKFVNTHRFDILMQPLVDQLENPLIIENEDMVKDYVACVSQLAVAVSNDVLWKQLNYQILLKTRTNEPEVRIISFNCCVEIARKLGEEFSTLLPETVPFIAELMEDDNLKVEGNTKRGVQELEKILGESLQKYF